MGKVIKWSEEEIELLKREYPVKSNEELKIIFSKHGRTIVSINVKASKIGLKKAYNDVENGNEEYKMCKKCLRMLKRDRFHFPVDDGCIDGLRSICRECNKKDKGFLKEDYTIPKIWTKEDEDLLKRVYHNYTNNEIICMFFMDRSNKGLQDKAYKLGCGGKSKEAMRRLQLEKSEKTSGVNNHNYGKPMSEETKRKLSLSRYEYYKTHVSPVKGKKLSKERRNQMSERMKAKNQWVGKNNPRVSNPLNGELNGNWKGGITPIYSELRTQIKEWKDDSMKVCNYKCVLTGGEFDNIHHLHPFRNIVDETFDICKLDIKQKVEDYTSTEFESLVKTLNELHIKYGFGVCLCKPIHKLFHDTYGYTNNNELQFDEFKERLKNGEFDECLNKYNLKLVI